MWHEVADHYLEAVKHRLYKGTDASVQYTLLNIGLGLTKFLAPLLPHVTEEVYQTYYKDLEGVKSIHLSNWPEKAFDEPEAIEQGKVIIDIIAALRRWKSSSGIPLNREIPLVEILAGEQEELVRSSLDDIRETIRIKSAELSTDAELTEKITGIKPNFSKIGPKYRGDAPEVIEFLKTAEMDELSGKFESGDYNVKLGSGKELKLSDDDFEFERELLSHGKKVETIKVGEIAILIPVDE
jgi:valyl-tRNA synthetase